MGRGRGRFWARFALKMFLSVFRTAEFFARLGAWQMKQYERTAPDYEPVKPLARSFDEVEAARASRFGAE